MKKYPILLCIPHSSSFVPDDLRRLMLLSDFEVKEQSDLYTDEIFDVPNAYILKANISRLVTDLNRAPDHIEMEYQLANDGVAISVTEDAKQIYKTPPSLGIIFERVQKYHDTYHKKIDEISSKMEFLIDCHSLRSVGPVTKNDAGEKRADIVLGNRHFTTCTREMTNKIMDFFREKGFSVKINAPYEGRYVLGYHCSRRGLPGIQIEINRYLYMNEKSLRPYKTKIKSLKKIIKELVEMVHTEIGKTELIKSA